METVNGKIERWKILAELLIKNNKSAYIKDINGNYYFGFIILSGDEKITIDCFGPQQRDGKREYLYWVQISDFDEFKEDKKR